MPAMPTVPTLRARRRTLAALATAGILAAVAVGAQPAHAGATTNPAAGRPATAAATTARRAERPYLALGDSVPFGYISGDGNAYVRPGNFVGFPAYVGRWLHLRTTNAACPGEATGGFVSATNPDDNGCRPYRASYPLHVGYDGTQLQFAERFLRAHRTTALVTIMLGANDGFRLESQCNGDLGCVLPQLDTLFATIGSNYATIVKGLRATGYRGPIMLVDYYSTDYTDTTQTLLSQTLDAELQKIARRHHLLLADTFDSMKRAAQAGSAAGNTCAAGLLNVKPGDPTACDVHPSQTGHRVIARTIDRAYRAWRADHPNA